MKKRNIFSILNIFLISFVIIMVSSAGISKAWAYFTTYAQAKGGYGFQFGYETFIKEEVSNWEKKVVISSKEGSQPIYVRAKAYCGKEFEQYLGYSVTNWTLGDDGYYYYNNIINGGDHTEALIVNISGIPENLKDSTEFNVVVIYESTLVRYRADGTPYADWTATLDSGSTEGGK